MRKKTLDSLAKRILQNQNAISLFQFSKFTVPTKYAQTGTPPNDEELDYTKTMEAGRNMLKNQLDSVGVNDSTFQHYILNEYWPQEVSKHEEQLGLLDAINLATENVINAIQNTPNIQVLNDNFTKITHEYDTHTTNVTDINEWLQALSIATTNWESIQEVHTGPDQTELPAGVVRIRETVLPQLERKLEQLIKVANKLGLPPPYLEVLDEEVVMNEKKGVGEKWLTVKVEGESPAVNGWEFIAKIEHHDPANIISSPTGEEIPQKYFTIDNICEHCGYKRRRLNTYLLRNQETGEYKQVGSTCLKDFTGHPNPEVIAKYFERLSNIDPDSIREMNDDPALLEGSSYERYYIDILTFLAHTSAMIKEHGWVSRSAAYDSYGDKIATADFAISNMFPTGFMKSTPITDDDKKLAKDALEWIKSRDENFYQQNNYLHNLWSAAQLDVAAYQHIGLLASLIPAYKKEVEKEQMKTRMIGGYVGDVGQRQEFIVTVEDIRVMDSQFAYNEKVYLTKMVDDSGNVIIWWGSRPLEMGQTYSMTAKVKGHKEYQGVPQTTISNPRSVNYHLT